MNENIKKLIFYVGIALVLFGIGFYARGRSNSGINGGLSAAIADNNRIKAELADARARVSDLEYELTRIRGTAGRIGEISAGFDEGITSLERSIGGSRESTQALANEHRTSGQLIGELVEILKRYGNPD